MIASLAPHDETGLSGNAYDVGGRMDWPQSLHTGRIHQTLDMAGKMALEMGLKLELELELELKLVMEMGMEMEMEIVMEKEPLHRPAQLP